MYKRQPPALARCINEGDTASLSRIPGIGKKTAERLCVELRDRLNASAQAAALPGQSAPAPEPADPVAEAVAALVALGFKPPEASQRIRAVQDPGLACEELVRLALQSVAR